VPPAPQQPSQQGQQPPQQQDDGLDDTALAVAIAAFLAGLTVTASYAVSIAVLLAALRTRFRLSRSALKALGAVLTFVTERPPVVTGTIGPASRQVQSMHAARRAQYVTAASKRVLAAEAEARAKGESVEAAREAALERERRYYAQHQAAMWQRSTAAGRIDLEVATHGPLLSWNAMHDGRATAECLAADRKNFYVTPPPYIGLPGIGPHFGCRCFPSAPRPGAKLLPGPGPLYARAA
jgi:hypothetical protein